MMMNKTFEVIDVLYRSARIKVRPSDSREDDFSLSLAEYFFKELKANGVQASRNQAYVKVKLCGSYDGFDHVVIDCVDGRLYLRSGGGDRYFGRLSKFNQRRRSDAYTCLNYNATRVINRIRKLEQMIVEASAVDTRQDDEVVLVVRDERVGCTNVYTRPLVVADVREQSSSINVVIASTDVRPYTPTVDVVVTAGDVRPYTRTVDVIVAQDDVRELDENIVIVDNFTVIDLRDECRGLRVATLLDTIKGKLGEIVSMARYKFEKIISGGVA